MKFIVLFDDDELNLNLFLIFLVKFTFFFVINGDNTVFLYALSIF